MGTFRRSRSPCALSLIIPALMDIFRTDKRKAKDRGKRTHVLVIGHLGGGKGGPGGRVLDPTMADTGRLLPKGVLFRPQVHPKVGLSLAEVYERVGKSVILAPGIWSAKKPKRANRGTLWL